jgi:hypothetical protein
MIVLLCEMLQGLNVFTGPAFCVKDWRLERCLKAGNVGRD